MSKLEELIKEYCPDGVEYKTLGEVCLFKRGTSLTSKDAKPGSIPAVSGGQKPAFYHNEYNRTGITITVAGSGAYAGFVNIWYEPIFCCDAFTIEPADEKILDIKYLYHFLLNNQEKIYAKKTGAGIPHVHGKDLYKFQIPLPPLPVQREIVRILDNFTELTAELTAELAARKKQYEYYRNQLLQFDSQVFSSVIKEVRPEDVVYKSFGDVVTFLNGRAYKRSELLDEGKYKVLRVGNFYSNDKWYYSDLELEENKYCDNGDLLYSWAATLGPKIWDEGKVIFHYHIWKLEFDETVVDKRYLYYFMQKDVEEISNSITNSTMPHVSMDSMKKRILALPPLPVQRQIRDVLDRFDVLCNDLTSGLPAEIEARQKQYEYYRDKLLSFEIKN